MLPKRTHIVVPPGLVAEIDALVGKRARSKFFVEAASREVRRRKQFNVIKETFGCLKGDNPEWERGSLHWVRKVRREWDRRLKKASGR